MDAAARTAHDSTLQPFSEMEHYKHADELPPEIMADSYDKLERLCLKYMNEDDFSKVEQAYCFAAEKHCNQKRRSGEMYINHPVEVAIILADLKMDCDVVCAALLHDTVEDTETSLADVSGLFGDTVAELVDGVTKLTNIEVDSMDEKQALTLRKMFLAMSKDIRVIIVKLADRLHNMRTLAALREDRRLFKARETMDVYAPLADRLGMSSIKWELEDLSFFYLEPDAYQRIARMVAESREVRERYLAETIKTLTDELNRIGLEGFQINGRSKHYWSIYQKMKRKGKEFSEIYDLVALRVITHSVRDCYSTLGAVHTLWHPMPGRFKDYIAMPKVNNYQSLHTTVIGPTARPLEIQIRTYEMHRTAEYGIAAHWKYKEGGSGKNDNEEQKLSWLRQILEWQTDTTDNKEFMNAIKTDLDLFSDQVYVFTPAGDVKNLPAGSTPIDFAYSIHTAVGNKLIGARVNGRQVPIETELHNGDRVEIITSQNSKGPSMDWLSVVKSSQAKTKINQWFRQENKTDNIQRGKDAMAAYCKTKGIVLSNLLQPELQEKVMKKYNFLTWDAVLASIGHGGLKEGQVVNRLQEEYKKEEAKKITEEQIVDKINTPGRGESHKHAKGGIVVKGMDDVAVRFSRCCAPVPGDEIVGYITRGRGVSIHRTDCVNVLCMDEFDRKRLIEAEWSEDLLQNQKMYMTEINIYANDSKGLVFSLSKIFNEENINLTGMNVRVNKQGKATVSVKFEIRSKEQLNKLIAKIRNVEGIIDIERTTG